MKLNCYSKTEFDYIMNNNIPKNAAFISICGTDEKDQHFFKDEAKNIINLDFDDIAGDSIEFEGKTLYGLLQNDANRLTKFIDQNIGKDFYIHCKAGQSRSQGVVRYILDCYSRYDYKTLEYNPCITPNLDVTAKLKRENRECCFDVAEMIREIGWVIKEIDYFTDDDRDLMAKFISFKLSGKSKTIKDNVKLNFYYNNTELDKQTTLTYTDKLTNIIVVAELSLGKAIEFLKENKK